jgi:hypothetical protein
MFHIVGKKREASKNKPIGFRRIKFKRVYALLVKTTIIPSNPPKTTSSPPNPPPMIPTIMSTIAQTRVLALLAPIIAITPQIIATIPKYAKANKPKWKIASPLKPIKSNNPKSTSSIPPIRAKMYAIREIDVSAIYEFTSLISLIRDLELFESSTPALLQSLQLF